MGDFEQISDSSSPTISPERRIHILYGDKTGGGHKFGSNKPCKSEFPQDWDENEILETVRLIAANDNADWRQEDNGYFVTEKTENDVKVRVVLGPDKQRVITAYPTNLPRNPCPANDNRR
ncbi:MAG: hypothetical protein DHS20C02_04800 [Micavibrio sp.]|nr:MAG: hypothetical protein DHS20C02_04800 [Micavibrio sp.]